MDFTEVSKVIKACYTLTLATANWSRVSIRRNLLFGS